MANLKEIRNRISSVSSTMQITSAMKMVSAAKLKRAQDAITQIRPYAEKLQEILGNVSATLDVSEGSYSEERSVQNALIIANTSNKGLCGGFNSSVVKATIRTANKLKDQGVTVDVLPIGRKSADALKYTDLLLSELPEGVIDIVDKLNYEKSSNIATYAMEAFTSKKYDKVIVIYNRFKNAAIQITEIEDFLPMVADTSETVANTDYLYEPNKNDIVEELIPKALKIQYYKTLLDSQASEHGARMTAMHKATDNANEMKKELKLHYNKARQAAITNEILEIVGGAEALNG